MRFWEKFKAWRRNERCIASGNVRGRVFEPKGGPGVRVKGLPKGTISARVQRAGSDTWEDLGVISQPGKEK